MSNQFNLEIQMQLVEKRVKYVDNIFSEGAYEVAFIPALTYKYDKVERVLDKLVYEVKTVRGKEALGIKCVSFSIVRPNACPLSIDKVEIKGIELETLKSKIEEFVSGFELHE